MRITLLFGGTNKERLVSVASAQALHQALPEADLWFWDVADTVHDVRSEALLNHRRPFEDVFEPGNRGVALELALDQAKADVASRQATLDQAKRDLERAKNLSSAAITVQQVEQRQQAVDVDQAELDAANAALEVANLNLERSTVVAPVNGIVTNFGLLPGRYVNAGAAVFALIDSDTFRVEGYFEETKLRRIRIGEDATVKLIGDARVLSGHVESIAYGIEDQNRSTSNELLAFVNPTFSWVRLAQRIPVRIKLDNVPPDLLLVAGRTATVSIGKISWW